MAKSEIPAGAGPTPFDVFVFYARPDRDWVRKVLLPPLRDADLDIVIDYTNFEPGVPQLSSIDEAIRQSTFTLLVISAAFHADAKSEFTLQTSVAERYGRVIPVLKEEVPPPVAPVLLRTVTTVDMAQPDDRVALLGRLTSADPNRVLRPTTQVRRALRSLPDLMKAPAVAQALIRGQTMLSAVAKQIRALSYQKYLHDLLHRLQAKVLPQILVVTKLFAEHPIDARLHLETAVELMQEIIAPLDEVTPADVFGARLRWKPELQQAALDLAHAAQFGDVAKYSAGRKALQSVLSKIPSNVNAQLISKAESLDLPVLAQQMTEVRHLVEREGPSGAAAAEFSRGAQRLEELNVHLQLLLRQHDTWQHIDDLLKEAAAQVDEANPSDRDLRLMEDQAANLDVLLDELPADTPSPKGDTLRQLKQAWAQGIHDTDLFAALKAFGKLRHAAGKKFMETDQALKAVCDDLMKISEPLNQCCAQLGELTS